MHRGPRKTAPHVARVIQATMGSLTTPGDRSPAPHVAAAITATRGLPRSLAVQPATPSGRNLAPAGPGQAARLPPRTAPALARLAPPQRPVATHVARALGTHGAQARLAPAAGAPRPLAPHVQAALGRAGRSAAVQPAMRTGVVQRMDYEYFDGPNEEFDEEIHEQDDFGNTVYKEPKGGWEDYGKRLEEDHRKQMEWEESEHVRQTYEQWQEQQEKEWKEYEKQAPTVDEMIHWEERHYEETYGPAIKVAQEFGKNGYLEAVHYLAKLDQRSIPNADRLLANFAQAMQQSQYAYASGYLFQIQQTFKLEEDGFKLLQVEPSLYELIGENRFGDTLVFNPMTGRQVIVEIKNWTGYLKGATKKSSIDVKNEREKERQIQLQGLEVQLTRYLKTDKDVLFIWKGQIAIDVMLALTKLKKESNGRFSYKTAN